MAVLRFFDRSRDRPVLIGPACLWIADPAFGLHETEALLERMVAQGIARYATPRENAELGFAPDVRGYFLVHPV